MAYNFLTVALPFLAMELEYGHGEVGVPAAETVRGHGRGIVSAGAGLLGVECQQEGWNASVTPF
jgi:hypothetical protein